MVSDLGKLSITLNKISAVHNTIAKVFEAIEEGEMADAHGTLGAAYDTLDKSCISLQKSAAYEFSRFFQFFRYELNSIEELLNTAADKKANLIRAEKRLKEKKDVLFAQKSVEKWRVEPGCTIPIDTLLKNKSIAFPEMLPDETRETNKLRLVFGYFSNKVLEEYTRVNKKDAEDIKAHFLKVAREQCNTFEDVI